MCSSFVHNKEYVSIDIMLWDRWLGREKQNDVPEKRGERERESESDCIRNIKYVYICQIHKYTYYIAIHSHNKVWVMPPLSQVLSQLAGNCLANSMMSLNRDDYLSLPSLLFHPTFPLRKYYRENLPYNRNIWNTQTDRGRHSNHWCLVSPPAYTCSYSV